MIVIIIIIIITIVINITILITVLIRLPRRQDATPELIRPVSLLTLWISEGLTRV